jgi:drug/metabolite transporter (DMT)-like permease
VTHKPTHIPLTASLMALSAGIVWSFGGLFVRLTDDDSTSAWQYLVWRSIGVVAVVEIGSALKGHRSRLVAAYRNGWVMIVGSLSLMLASVSYVYAVKNTTAINAALFASMTPLVTAVIAWLVLRERMDRLTVGAILLAGAGLLIMVQGSSPATDGSHLSGDLAALLSALGFAGYTVCVRSSASTDWSPILPGYALMTIVLCGAVTVSQGRSLAPRAGDIAWALAHGGVLIVVGTLLFNAGSKRVPAGPMAVFAQTESVFVPLWIFLALGERPGAWALLGAAVILTAVIGKAVIDARRASKATRHASLPATAPPIVSAG